MVLPGLLIEYLVVGSMALLWLLPLSSIEIESQIPFGKAVILAPTIYVLGMFVDFVAFVLVTRIPNRNFSLKALARWFVKRKSDIKNIDESVFKDGYGRSSRGIIWLYLKAPDLIREVQGRSSRDRVARGAFVNILIMWLVFSGYGYQGIEVLESLSNLKWFLLALFSLFVWCFLEVNSYGFELRAGDMVPDDEK